MVRIQCGKCNAEHPLEDLELHKASNLMLCPSCMGEQPRKGFLSRVFK
ncbi:MAG: hypothetical protein ABIH34_00645 [Nanoarchaeota archaeon]